MRIRTLITGIITGLILSIPLVAYGASSVSDSETITNYGGLPSLHFDRANGTSTSPTSILNGDPIGALGVRGWTGAEFSPHSTGALYFRATENHNSTHQGTNFELWVTPTGHPWSDRFAAVVGDGSKVKFNVPVEFTSVSGPVDMDSYASFGGTLTGWSSTTRDERFFKQNGLEVHFIINIAGTSNSTSVTIAMPVAASTSFYRIEGQAGLGTNNGTAGTARWSIDPATNNMTLWTGTAGAWTASGTKEVRLEGFYQAQPE